jgi:hypothetical protein
MTVDTDTTPYPVRFTVEYPDRPLNRLTTAFRIIVAIPILILLESVSGGRYTVGHHGGAAMYGAGGMLVLAPLLMILFRQKTHGGGSTGTWSSSG